jgi:monoamine oxidase
VGVHIGKYSLSIGHDGEYAVDEQKRHTAPYTVERVGRVQAAATHVASETLRD